MRFEKNMKFIGHTAIQTRLEKFLSSQDNSRAFLFSGPKYSGKYTLAKAFLESFVREEKALDRYLSSTVTSGDLVEIAPIIEEKKGIIKEKPIDIESIRAGIRSVSLSSAHHGRKALLIDEAQKMNSAAQNALLKTLEEPVGKTVIVLVAHTLDTLLPTILSRCERVQFGIVARKDFQSTSSLGVDVDILWKLSLGLPGLSIRLVKEKELLEQRLKFFKKAENIDTLDMGDRLRLGEELSKNIPKAIEVLELWAFCFRLAGLSGDEKRRIYFARVEKMYECVNLLKNTQVNTRLILENTILGL